MLLTARGLALLRLPRDNIPDPRAGPGPLAPVLAVEHLGCEELGGSLIAAATLAADPAGFPLVNQARTDTKG